MRSEIKEKISQFILLCIYTFCPPFYMMTLTYLLDTYQNINNFILSEIIPIFWQTIWIPACVALIINLFLHYRQSKHLSLDKKIKDYPLIFILSYAVYFIILGKLSAGSECMYSGISGLLIVFFARLFRESLRKYVEYLPLGEKVYAYMVVFLFPIFILLVTDAVSLMQKWPFYMTVLLAPISYIGGISMFLGACVILNLWCSYHHISLKKNTYTLAQVILLLLIGDNAAFLYLVPYVGNTLFIIGLFMSISLYIIEYLYHIKRKTKRLKLN